MASVVLVEDDIAMRQFLALSLERGGHHVITFPDGRDAYAYLAETGNKVDLLLTDIIMPGMDGIELAARAHELRPDLKTLYITGFNTMPRPLEARAPVLTKPLHLGALLAEVARILNERQ